MARSMQELAKEALRVQDACNLSGVVHGFARCMSDLLGAEYGLSTDEANTHPIAQVWADKVAHLTGTQTLGNKAVMKSFEIVSKLAEDE